VANEEDGMATVERIDPGEARRKVTSGQALLVCAYDDEAKCRQIALDGAISLAELGSRLASLPKDTELIFYCA
jgi:hypothetical protein